MVGWVGGIIYLFSDLLLTRKSIIGWFLKVVGACVYIYVGIYLSLTSTVAMQLITITIAIFGIRKYKETNGKR